MPVKTMAVTMTVVCPPEIKARGLQVCVQVVCASYGHNFCAKDAVLVLIICIHLLCTDDLQLIVYISGLGLCT